MSKKEIKSINKKERTTRIHWLKNSDDSLRKNKIYGNCRVYSPSGNLMFLCVEKKAKWYLDRTNQETGEPLAKEIRHINPVLNFLMTIFGVQPNGLRVQLLFEPKNEGNKGDKYSLSRKYNRCVVTGDRNLERLTKHHITPYCYRTYLPDEYKSANSHDVVPIVDEKHYEYEREADKLKQKISKIYDAPIDGKKNIDHKLFYAIKSAFGIKNHGDKMPEDVVNRLRDRVKEYYGVSEITEDMIDALASRNYDDAIVIKSHGQIVVEKLIEEGPQAIQDFVEMWREHFIQNAKPKYMPKYWDIKRPASRLDVKLQID
ncbi:MAG: hypothetical protein AABY15_05385 [Nanoarchaeota archaeon]